MVGNTAGSYNLNSHQTLTKQLEQLIQDKLKFNWLLIKSIAFPVVLTQWHLQIMRQPNF